MTETLCITPCECECGNENVPRCCIAGGMTLWVVDYTVTEHGRESSFVTVHAAECAARQLVANLLRDRQLGTEVSDVYSERT